MAEAGSSPEVGSPPPPDTEAPNAAPDTAASTQTPDIPPAPDTDTPEQDNGAERVQERRVNETQQLASNIFRGRYEGMSPEDRWADKTAQSIYVSEDFGNLTEERFANGPLKFPEQSGTDQGEPIKVNIAGREGTLIHINGLEGDENYACDVMYADNPDVLEPQTIPRQEVFQANLLSEKENILNGFDGDQRVVVEKYFDLIDPKVTDKPELGDDYQKQLEAVARERGMMTTGDIRQAIENYSAGAELSDTAKTFLAGLEGKTLANKTDMKEALTVMGVSRTALRQEAVTLQQQIDALKDRTDDVGVRQRQELEGQMKVLDNADKIWEEAEQKGETPYDKYFDELIDGKVKPDRAKKIVEAFSKGDMDSLIDEVPDLSEEERSQFKKYAGKAGKGLLYIVLGAIIGASAGALYAAGLAGGIGGAALRGQK